jgi:protein-S-isoprenylcysteine O-methyltransferase Ste14
VFVCIVNVMAAVSIGVCWGLFAVVWLVTAGYNGTRAPQVRQRSWYGTGVGPVVLVTVVVRLIVPRGDWSSLTFAAPWARFAGLAILLAATGLTLWARFVLGVMWSAVPAVKEGHQLRTGGPYAVTRHPIYTGLLGMLLGTMLVAGGGVWIVSFPVAVVLIEYKIRIEERFMTEEFPEDYPTYRQRVPQLIPGLRLRTSRP